MNSVTKQKDTHRLRERTYGCWRWMGRTDSWVVCMDTYILLCLKWIADRTSCIAHETLLNVAWWPGWEGSLGEWIHVYV